MAVIKKVTIKCDRCKKTSDEVKGRFLPVSAGEHKKYDLCPKCSREFDYFFRGAEIKPETRRY